MKAATPARPRTVVLVSGSGSNLQAIIDRVQAGEISLELAGVISDRPATHALVRAQLAGIPAHTLDYREFGDREKFAAALGDLLQALDTGLVVLAGFMRILPARLVDRYRGRMLNVHPSLLPKYPGLDTYRRVLQAGDAWHGSTVHFVIPELDAGPAIIQYRLPVRPGESEESLRSRVQRGEHVIYPRALQWLATGRLACQDGRAWLDGKLLEYPETVLEATPGA